MTLTLETLAQLEKSLWALPPESLSTLAPSLPELVRLARLQLLSEAAHQPTEEARQQATQSLCAQAWDDGLDFAGNALRAGCSLSEAASGNPYR